MLMTPEIPSDHENQNEIRDENNFKGDQFRNHQVPRKLGFVKVVGNRNLYRPTKYSTYSREILSGPQQNESTDIFSNPILVREDSYW